MEIVIAVDDLRKKYRPKSRKGVEVTALDGWLFAAFGMVMGTIVPSQQISLLLTLLLAPMIFFGCAYYP